MKFGNPVASWEAVGRIFVVSAARYSRVVNGVRPGVGARKESPPENCRWNFVCNEW